MNPWPAVYLVEAFVLVAALQLLFQHICGSLRRGTTNLFIHGELWLGYTLLPPLITYTLGLMHSSAVDVVLYPIWALSLLLVVSTPSRPMTSMTTSSGSGIYSMFFSAIYTSA